jgi:hypothetical protein
VSFWDNVFTPSQPQRQAINPPLTLGQPKAWWQDPDPYGTVQGDSPVQQTQQVRQQDLKQIRKRGHQNISPEEAEAIAEYDLATKPKHQNRCPECDSGNFIPAGTRVNVGGIGTMPTDKCFDCGYSARGPERAVGGSSGGGSIHTRQIDTGGAGGQSMFGRFNGVPRTYMPKI